MTQDIFQRIPFPGLAADLMLVVHALCVAFVVGGQLAVFLGWARDWTWTRNPWFRGVHLALVAYIVVQTLLGELCPLTVWEARLREAAGQTHFEGSFIQHWVGRLLYWDLPWWVFQLVYTVFGALVVLSWLRHPPRKPVRS